MSMFGLILLNFGQISGVKALEVWVKVEIESLGIEISG